MFQDEQFMTAADKEEVLADWNTFIHSGFRREHFTDKLYKHLTVHCGLSARVNINEFWANYFNSVAAPLATFFNQFGGTKVSAESRWLDWRGGNAGDLKEAMIALAEDFWPVFESVLTGYAQECYEAEKWADAQLYQDKLPGSMQSAQTLSHMGLIFELTFPFEVYLDYLPVDEELRRRLSNRAVRPADPAPPPAVAAIQTAQWNLNGRAAQLVQARQVPLFDAAVAQAESAAQTLLARKIADLSVTEVLATGIRHASPVVIDGQKILYADK